MRRFIKWLSILCVVVLTGCMTTSRETKPVSWSDQQAYLDRVCDPRLYGLSIYQTPAGPRIRGGGRLHPSRAEALPLLLEEPVRPVVNLNGPAGVQWPVLLDCTAPVSVFEFDTALDAGARPVAEGTAKLTQLPGQEVPACVSLISSLRLGQLYVENQLLAVRMANGDLGRVARGIDEPGLKGVVGWDVLQHFAQIQLLYPIGQVVLKTTEDYAPNPSLLLADTAIADRAGACAVRGTVNGQPEWILIDPVGDFDVAAGPGVTIEELVFSDEVSVVRPAIAASPGGIRVGARFLERYQVTICPKAGRVYFEALPQGEE